MGNADSTAIQSNYQRLLFNTTDDISVVGNWTKLRQLSVGMDKVCGITPDLSTLCRSTKIANDPWKDVLGGIKAFSGIAVDSVNNSTRGCAMSSGSPSVYCTEDLGTKNWNLKPTPFPLQQFDISENSICGIDSKYKLHCSTILPNPDKTQGNWTLQTLEKTNGTLNTTTGPSSFHQVSLSGKAACSLWNGVVYFTKELNNNGTNWTVLNSTSKFTQIDFTGDLVCGIDTTSAASCRQTGANSTWTTYGSGLSSVAIQKTGNSYAAIVIDKKQFVAHGNLVLPNKQ